jgi:rare lipoprotein A (peptidoglycan hydrolase)
MLRSLIAAAIALAVISSSAEARQRQKAAPAHDRCNIDWPCQDVTTSPRGEMTVKAMGGFGSARKAYTPGGRTKAPAKKPGAVSWREPVQPMSTGRSFAGVASFYGNESGSKTASGQRFNQNAMTAAHRSLPFGTKLRVTHKGRSVVVTINDRGPFIKGRVLDLSTGAARAVGLTSSGVGHVTCEVI